MQPATSSRRSARTRPRHAAAALLAAAALCAACASGSTAESGTRVASIDHEGGGGAAEVDAAAALEAPENPEDAFDLYDGCMAEAGFELGIATTSSGGSLGSASIAVTPDGNTTDGADPQAGGSVDEFDLEDFEAAHGLCEGHLANVDGLADMSPEEQAAFEDAQLAWSRCLEDQGIELPEIDVSGSGGSVAIVSDPIEVDPQQGVPSFDDVELEALEQAFEVCDHHFADIGVGAAAGTDGEGS